VSRYSLNERRLRKTLEEARRPFQRVPSRVVWK
jgi:hypothetical protein